MLAQRYRHKVLFVQRLHLAVADVGGTRQICPMCHFITLIVPTDDVAALREVMKRHGRTAEPIDNHSLRKILREDERQYLTRLRHCDCGTVLARRPDTAEELAQKVMREKARMRGKGWSDAKITRAIEDRRKAGAGPRNAGPDSLELWNAVLHDLQAQLKLPTVGLFVRSYSGSIATETFSASRRELLEDMPWQDALAALEHDEVTIFSR